MVAPAEADADVEGVRTDDGLDGLGDGAINDSPNVKPFDPNKIRVRQVSMPVFTVCQKLKHGEIDLAPEFQRRAGLWKDHAKSRLIESLLIRIPLPAFYLEEVTPPRGAADGAQYFTAVDGVQRLTVLRLFLVEEDREKQLRLSGLEFLKALEGMAFDELPSALQRRIMETTLVVYVIEPGTPSAAKLNIFKRINTGGVALTAQEIRHAMNPGPVRAYLQELAESEEFKEATWWGVDGSRMADREMVARFFAFRDGGRERYAASQDLDAFINDTMVALNELTPRQRQALGERFLRAMTASKEILGKWSFRRPTGAGKRSPVNKAIFEAWAVSLDEQSDRILDVLKARSTAVLKAYRSRFANNPTFVESVSVGTGDVRRVQRRFNELRLVIEDATK